MTEFPTRKETRDALPMPKQIARHKVRVMTYVELILCGITISTFAFTALIVKTCIELMLEGS